MAIPQRGLCDIRTHSGKVDQAATPYKAHLRIGCLEMERARRLKESEAALRRVKNNWARFQEIEAEKAALLKALAAVEPQSGPSIQASGRSAKPAPQKNRDGFKLRY